MEDNISVEETVFPLALTEVEEAGFPLALTEDEIIHEYDPTFFDGLTAFNFQDDNMLSSMEALSREIDEAIHQLSSMPTNLYDAEKAVLFGRDYKFTTLAEYTVPKDFVMTKIVENVEASYDRYEATMLDIIQTPSNFDLGEDFYGMSMLFEMSGNKVWESEEKRKQYIMHLEMLMSIDISDIDESNCLEIINKIAHSTNNLLVL